MSIIWKHLLKYTFNKWLYGMLHCDCNVYLVYKLQTKVIIWDGVEI